MLPCDRTVVYQQRYARLLSLAYDKAEQIDALPSLQGRCVVETLILPTREPPFRTAAEGSATQRKRSGRSYLDANPGPRTSK
jgi:hypothetical protein